MNGFPAITIHGDKVQMEREQALKSFKNGTTPILVATVIASCGLDIPHVAHFIDFDLPKDIGDYVLRIGSSGRASKSGLVTAFFCDKNLPLAKALAELMQESNQEVPSWLNQHAERSTSVGQGKCYGQLGLVAMTTEMPNPGVRITAIQATMRVQILLLVLLLVLLTVLLMLVLLVVVNAMLLQMRIHMPLMDMEKAMNR